MITNRILNKIGIECEVLIRNNKNELIIPASYDLPHDDFIILGEIRSLPHDNIPDTLFGFMKDFYLFKEKVEKLKLHIDTEKGHDIISPENYSDILKMMGSKGIENCKNIYGTDILQLSDTILEDDKVVGHKISAGLHIHFSSDVIATSRIRIDDYLNVKGNLYYKSGSKDIIEETKLYSLITNNVIKSIVKGFDNDILPIYSSQDIVLKFRNPGFYELKSYGFEYRSLPCNNLVINNLDKIIKYAFDKLNKLSKVLV